MRRRRHRCRARSERAVSAGSDMVGGRLEGGGSNVRHAVETEAEPWISKQVFRVKGVRIVI